MAFVLPSFNIVVNVWRVNGTGANYAAPDVTPIANLTPGRRVMQNLAGAGSFTNYDQIMELLLPPLTDIRASWNGLLPDLVECPSGSGRFYNVIWVDDVGKGFANEHRIAQIQYLKSGAVPPFGIGFPVGAPQRVDEWTEHKKGLASKLENERKARADTEWRLEIQGKRITLKRLDYTQAVRPYYGRGEITSFSWKARARMLRRISSIDWIKAGRGLFMTLTYPPECEDHTMCERSKHRYLMHRWIEKEVGCKTAVAWRVEWLPRRSGPTIGQIAPHMHLIVFTSKGLCAARTMRFWMRVIGSRRHTQLKIQRLQVGEMPAVYAAKYCAKVTNATILDNVPKRNKTGRHAGWLRAGLIPYHPLEVVERLDAEVAQLLRHRANE
ncbi:hypothetical protein Q9L58_010743, partial [Maublancomyces gigas]